MHTCGSKRYFFLTVFVIKFMSELLHITIKSNNLLDKRNRHNSRSLVITDFCRNSEENVR